MSWFSRPVSPPVSFGIPAPLPCSFRSVIPLARGFLPVRVFRVAFTSSDPCLRSEERRVGRVRSCFPLRIRVPFDRSSRWRAAFSQSVFSASHSLHRLHVLVLAPCFSPGFVRDSRFASVFLSIGHPVGARLSPSPGFPRRIHFIGSMS